MEAGGVFVSGGSEANFTGIAVARNAKAKVDMKVDGMQSVTKKMTLYCSKETHDCLARAVIRSYSFYFPLQGRIPSIGLISFLFGKRYIVLRLIEPL
jgi:hypothetical protein